MKRFAFLTALLAAPLFLAAPASADETCEAKSWGLSGEKKACFTATVVDMLCEITGDCPDNCGDGTRQLGLVRTDDDVLVYPQKNIQAAFNGAVADLQPFCDKTVDVRGWYVGDEETLKGSPQRLYQVQWIRETGGEWSMANRWTKDWAEKNPNAAGEGPWFRRDPRIKAEIEKNGYLGLGPEEDIVFIKDWY